MRVTRLAIKAPCSAKPIGSCWYFAKLERADALDCAPQTELSQREIALESIAPVWRAASWPPRKTIMVGMLRMLKRDAGAGSSWVLSFANRNLGSNADALAS